MTEQSQEGRAYVRHEIPMYGGHVISKEIELSLRDVKNTIDPLWFEPIEETPLQEQVIISSDDDKVTMRLPVDSLISLIKNSVEGGTSPFETKIISPEREDTIKLSIEVWKRWLIRGNSGQEQFMTIFVRAVKVDAGRKQFLSSL